MNTAPASGLAFELPNLVRADLAHVDLLDDVALYKCAETAITESKEQYTEAIASRLDSLLAVRLIRLLRSTTATEPHLESLDRLIAGLSRDKFRAPLDGLSRPYFARWSCYRELVSKAIAALRWEQEQTQATRTAANHGQTDWETVAGLVLKAGDAGMPWSELADKVLSMTRRRSRGGVSQLVTSLRAARWVEVLAEPHSQRKRVYPGPKIAESAAWKNLNGGDRVSEPSTAPSRIVDPADPIAVRGTKDGSRPIWANVQRDLDHSPPRSSAPTPLLREMAAPN